MLKVPAVLVLFGASMAQLAPPAPRDGVITGQVVDAVSGRPVGAVIVSITGAGVPLRTISGPSTGFALSAGSPRILTGGDGRFVFRDLSAGSYTILAFKGGYADGASGRRVIGGPPQSVVLTAAQKSADVSVRIWKQGAITGTIVDESGEPVVGVQVRAARRTFAGGRRRFVPGGTSAATDDRGVYRLSGLVPGDYLIAASPPSLSAQASAFTDIAGTGRGSGEMLGVLGRAGTPNGIQVGDALLTLGRGGAIPPPPAGGRVQMYPMTFHPSALRPAQATTIALAVGEERTGVDLQLQPVPTVRLSGTVMGASGPAEGVTLRLMPAGVEELAADALAPVSFADRAGSFTFVAVFPGQYSLRAIGRGGPTSGPGADTYWLDMPITVAGDDVDGVVAVMRPSLKISGRYEFEGSAPRPAIRPGQFTPSPFTLESDDSVSSAGLAGSVGEQGFTFGGFTAGKYRVRVQNSPAGWMFKAAMLNGVDVSETLFDFNRDVSDLVLTFTDRWSGMSGTVQGAGAAGAMILAFTTNTQAWENAGTAPRRLKTTRANDRREFGLSSVPPGDYYAIAVPEEQVTDWRDPKTLEALARLATQVSIAEGEHKTIELRIKEVRQ